MNAGSLATALVLVHLGALRPVQAATFEPELRLGGRALAEMWQDPALGRIYRSSRFGGAGLGGFWFDVGLPVNFGVEADFSYHRMSGAAVSLSTNQTSDRMATIEILPAAFRGCVGYSVGQATVYGSLGPAVTGYQESAPQLSLAGNKVGLAMEGGIRFDTRFVDTPMGYPPRALKGVDAEVFAGRRQHQLFGVGEGLDLSAWRLGAGLVARF